MAHKKTAIIPRAELWLGSDIFREFGLEDDIESHVKVRKTLGMDLLFVPVSKQDRTAQTQGYRYFGLEELKKALEISEVPVGVVIDGPFQGLTEKKGLMNVFSGWIKNRDSIEKDLMRETNRSISLIRDSLEIKPHIVVIADDIAYEKGPYLNHEDMERLFEPFYIRAVDLIHAFGAYALYHSCGNLTKIIPDIISYGFDGLAACQGNPMDILAIKKEYGSRLTLLTGIDAELLQAELIDEEMKEHFIKKISLLASKGGFILGSSCGLYSKKFLDQLSVLYKISERTDFKSL
ncbi:MAG: hypothetical protein JW882_21745 [Deltaproteobacteria bacterium]|nr:hypothetical protein [Deltaproteobacteria bacterium]